MTKMFSIITVLILLIPTPLSPFSAQEAHADTRITVTFAAGGAACGVYFFLRFTFRGSSLMMQDQDDHPALFNRNAEGFYLAYPELNVITDDRSGGYRPGNSPGTVHMNILQWRF